MLIPLTHRPAAAVRRLIQLLLQPERGPLALGICTRQIVIARTYSDIARRFEQLEIVQHDDDLRIERSARTDVQMIADQYHEIERRRRGYDPIELS